MSDDMVKRVAQAMHEHLCRRDVMQYLDNGEDCEALAQAAIVAMQADTTPVAWALHFEPDPSIFEVEFAYPNRKPLTVADEDAGWTATPLYAHPTVDDRVSTPTPVDVSETGDTSDKLRDAREAAARAALEAAAKAIRAIDPAQFREPKND